MLMNRPPSESSDSDVDADGQPKRHIIYAYDAAAEREKERQLIAQQEKDRQAALARSKTVTSITGEGRRSSIMSEGRRSSLSRRKKSSVEEKAPVLPMLDVGGDLTVSGGKGKGKAVNGR
jgi:sRNA-binding protein